MLHFSKIKIFSLLFTTLLIFLLAMPSFFPHYFNNKLFNKINKVNLGLDLKGGTHLMIEIDFKYFFDEQLQNLKDEVRKNLYDNNIKAIVNLRNDKIEISLNESRKIGDVKKIIDDNFPEITIEEGDGKIFSLRLYFDNSAIEKMKSKLTSQSIEILRRRIDENGTKEPIIQPQGDDLILLQIANDSNISKEQNADYAKSLKESIGKTAKMTFRFVDDNAVSGSKNLLHSSDSSVMYDDSGNQYLIENKIILSGDLLTDANPTYFEGSPAVAFRFNNIGAKKFAEITKENIGKFFAIVLDNKVITAPRINTVINQGSGVISGNFTVQEASQLALLLRAGALPAPLKIVEERLVGPSLGEDSIRQGTIASIAGIVLVGVFMIIFYGSFGLFANIGMVVNVCAIIAILSMIQATLTLPGIAGIVLTMGMAVDANVLIFERIKEEARNHNSGKKKNILLLVEQGFSQAFRTITDSNITTLIVALFLYLLGSGSVKGFAVTLSIGILCSLFSSVLLTRMMIAMYLQYLKKRHKLEMVNKSLFYKR
jgi:preprotein translocase subunit SecD